MKVALTVAVVPDAELRKENVADPAPPATWSISVAFSSIIISTLYSPSRITDVRMAFAPQGDHVRVSRLHQPPATDKGLAAVEVRSVRLPFAVASILHEQPLFADVFGPV